MADQDTKLSKMLETNRAQADYYNQTDGGLTSEVNGLATNLWRTIRRRAFVAVSNKERHRLYDIHKEWMGDLSEKKVLELGVGHGCRLTKYIAQEAGDYHALDLSKREIELLKNRLGKSVKMTPHIVDFLSPEFREREFDVIYAHAVLHHLNTLMSHWTSWSPAWPQAA